MILLQIFRLVVVVGCTVLMIVFGVNAIIHHWWSGLALDGLFLLPIWLYIYDPAGVFEKENRGAP